MGEEETAPPPPPQPQPQPQPAASPQPPASPQRQSDVPKFDPSRMIGIIRRKALIKDLAASYHAECLGYCHELFELQRRWEEETSKEIKSYEDSRKDTVRPVKRAKKVR